MPAVQDLSFSVTESEFVAIMGSSGSGKTTLLNCISLIDQIETGNIIVCGESILSFTDQSLAQFRREHLGFIFQEYNLLDTLTVEENIAFPLSLQKRPLKEIRTKVEELAESLGILSILDRFPYEVSGGQRQRAACARALISTPSLILADEPTGALDSNSSAALLDIFQRMVREFSTTILMVTHDPFVASFADRILFLQDGTIYKELVKGDSNRKDFANIIFSTMASLE